MLTAAGQADQSLLMDRAWWKIVPLVMLTYLVSVIDKQNVSFAKLQMVHDLHMTEATYGFASSLYFIGYVLAEIPSAFALGRFGARRWFARIMLTWGIASVLLVFCRSGSSFSFFRFLVGLAEGGLYPGIIFYYGLWFVGKPRVKALAVLTVGSALGNMLGSVLGGISFSLNGILGLSGWQWIFVVTGMPAIFLVPVVFFFLPSGPSEAKFFSSEEKLRLTASLADGQPGGASHGGVLRALWDSRVLLFALAYTFLLTAYYGVIYWMPTVVKQFGVGNTVNGLLNMIPWALAAVALIAIPRYFRINSILGILSLISAVGLLCFFGSVGFASPASRFAALSFGTVSVSLLLPCFWYFASRFFTDSTAVVSIAAICSYANLGGFFAQNAMPRVAHSLGSPVAAMIVPAACLLVLGLAAFAIRFYPYVTGQLGAERTTAPAAAK